MKRDVVVRCSPDKTSPRPPRQMAYSREKFLEIKLVFLEEQEQQLSSLIHKKIDKVVTTGKAWLSDSSEREERCSFTDISQMIDDAIKFVTQKFNEIEGVSEESLPQGSSVKSSGKVSVASLDSSSLPADKQEIKPLESRVTKMETAVTAIIDNLEMLMARQTNIENGMGDLTFRQSKTEDKWTKQFTQIQDKMTDLRQKEDEFVQQNDRKIQSLEEELQTIRNSQGELNKGLADGAESKESVQANLNLLQQDMGNVQIDVQKLREEIQKHGEAIETSNEDTVKLRKLTDDLSSLKPKIKCLEIKNNRPVVGFTAAFRNDVKLTDGATCTGYTLGRCNTDGSFNEKTGIFTTPVKGMCVVCLRLWQMKDGDVILHGRKTRTQQSKREVLLATRTLKPESGDTDIQVTDLDIGDTIHIEVYKVSGNPGLRIATQFTCFVIG